MWTDKWANRTIGSVLDEAARKWGSKEAFSFVNGFYTFDELKQEADQLAKGFMKLGVKKGDKVAVWMGGYAEWACVYYGLLKIGAIIVPINVRYRPVEMEYVLNKSDASILVFKDEKTKSKEYIATLRELCPEVADCEPENLEISRLPSIRRIVVIGQSKHSGMLSFADVMLLGNEIPSDQLAERQIRGDDIALIQFTSGTTALPKGAMLTHEAMLRAAYYALEAPGFDEQDCYFSPQPFYHVGGSVSVMLAPLVAGCHVVVQPYFDPGEALATMEAKRCTATIGHQPHYIEYLHHPDIEKRKLNIRKAFIFANTEVMRQVAERMNIPFLTSPYGLSESTLSGTRCTEEDPVDLRMSTLGRPTPGMEVRIQDIDTKEWVSPGTEGEVCLRGWGIMKGYYSDPEKTAEVIDAEGWFHTGDMGIISQKGYLQLVGRIKDTIRVGGENVSANELETVLSKHPQVKQVQVVGVPDERLGEVCFAFVENRKGETLNEEEFMAFCKRQLGSFKVPRYIKIITEWPMSGTGKIQKFSLRENALEEIQDRTV